MQKIFFIELKGELRIFEKTVTKSIYWLLIFSPQIVFDECHKSKNYSASTASSKTGDASVALQDMYPLARMLYVSATAASKPKHLLHMTRLNLWGPHSPYKSADMFVNDMNDRFLKIKFSNWMLYLFLVCCFCFYAEKL